MLLSRRSALAVAGVTLLGTSACDVDDLRPPEDDAAPSPTPSEPGEPTNDEQIVDDVVLSISGQIALLQTARRAPGLRASVTPLLRAHRRHLEVLEGELAPGPERATLTLPELRQSEQSLRALVVEAAGRAESGALARLLASIAASTSQHLAALR